MITAMRRTLGLVALLVLVTSACGGSLPAAAPTVTATVTVQTPGPTAFVQTPGPAVVVETPGPTVTVAPAPNVTVTVPGPRTTVTVTADPAVSADPAVAAAGAGFAGDGTYLVGSDVKAGTYRSGTPTSGNCYWARLSNTDGSGETSGILANNNSAGPSVVTIRKSDEAFESSGCEDWTRVG